MKSSGFRAKRVALVAGVLTPIWPPHTTKTVSIGNATTGDVQVHTHDDESEYLVIAAGYERTIPVERYQFWTDRIAFWLKATNAGTVVILWY